MCIKSQPNCIHQHHCLHISADVSKSFYVGDSEGDQGFAARVGLRCFRPGSFFKGGGCPCLSLVASCPQLLRQLGASQKGGCLRLGSLLFERLEAGSAALHSLCGCCIAAPALCLSLLP